MAQELAAAKRERDFYLSRVDRAKALEAMQQRRQAKQHKTDGAGGAGGGSDAAAAPAAPAAGCGGASGSGASGGSGGGGEGGKGDRQEGGVKRGYGQRKAKPDPAQPGAAGGIADDVLGLLVAPKAKKARS